MSGLLVVGAGGHGKVVADTAYQTGRWEKISFLDDRYPVINNILEWPIIGTINQAAAFLEAYPELVVAIGNNLLRSSLLREFKKLGFQLPNIIHPTAFVSKSVTIEAGSVIFAQVAINASTSIGFGSIINTGATIDHDCQIGEAVHISPGVHLAGEVNVGKYSWIGVGSSVIHQVTIGENVVIGAGTVVVKSLESNVTVVGVPGKVIRNNYLGGGT